MSGSDLLIRMEQVAVCYRGRRLFRGTSEHWALRDVSLTLNSGDTLGIIGRNGAGKTTLLKLMADIIRSDRGRVWRQPCRCVILSLRLGFLGHLNARDNIIMSGMLFGVPRREIESLVPEILAFAELEAFADAPVATYSLGMSARLGFSIAMQLDPDIMLIDEMLSVGDADFREKSARILRERMRSNKTVVLVAHNEEAVKKLCTRVVWIEDGATRMEGEPEEVVQAYRDYLQRQKQQQRPAQALAAKPDQGPG